MHMCFVYVMHELIYALINNCMIIQYLITYCFYCHFIDHMHDSSWISCMLVHMHTIYIYGLWYAAIGKTICSLNLSSYNYILHVISFVVMVMYILHLKFVCCMNHNHHYTTLSCRPSKWHVIIEPLPAQLNSHCHHAPTSHTSTMCQLHYVHIRKYMLITK